VAIRREAFVPDTIWVDGEDGWLVPLRRDDDPEAWLRLASGDGPVAIQVDDGESGRYGQAPDQGFLPTSSNTAAWLVEEMLAALDADAGMDVLEIGAGTGYNAARLAERVGVSGHVTTVEIDPFVAGHAAAALRRNGSPAVVVVGDGALGCSSRAPYDRVVATAAVTNVPAAWVAQVRAGGRIVLPLAGTFQHGALLTLAVDGEGGAHGRFIGEAPFIRLRSHRPDLSTRRRRPRADRVRSAPMFPREPFVGFDAGLAIGAALPGCVAARREEGPRGPETLILSCPLSGSWATVSRGEDEVHRVEQRGPRDLWEDLRAALGWWEDAGRPGHDRIGLSVTRAGDVFWLDTPSQPVPSHRWAGGGGRRAAARHRPAIARRALW
jgi:protein-L-isoaspartate(D-aspartate) O-methyltransferase